MSVNGGKLNRNDDGAAVVGGDECLPLTASLHINKFHPLKGWVVSYETIYRSFRAITCWSRIHKLHTLLKYYGTIYFTSTI